MKVLGQAVQVSGKPRLQQIGTIPPIPPDLFRDGLHFIEASEAAAMVLRRGLNGAARPGKELIQFSWAFCQYCLLLVASSSQYESWGGKKGVVRNCSNLSFVVPFLFP